MTKRYSVGRKSKVNGNVDRVNPHLISIGDHTIIGALSSLITHCPIRGGKPVTIGDGCFIGRGAIILPDVIIGDGAIIGAGAVVTKDVEPMAIVAGNPAGFIRYRSEENLQEQIDLLEKGGQIGKVE